MELVGRRHWCGLHERIGLTEEPVDRRAGSAELAGWQGK